MSDHLPDEEFEKLFQKGSDKYDFEYNPRAWRDMETLLDRKRQRKLAFWWFGSLLGIVLLLLVAHVAGVFDFESRELTSSDADNIDQEVNSLLPPTQSDHVIGKKNDEIKDINDTGDQFDNSAVNQTRAETKELSRLNDQAISNGNSINSQQLITSQAVSIPDTHPLADQKNPVSTRSSETYTDQVAISSDDQERNPAIEQEEGQSISEDVKPDNIVTSEKLTVQSSQGIGARESHLNRLSTRAVSDMPITTLNSMPHSIIPVPVNQRDDQSISSRALILGLSFGISSSSAGTMGYSDFDPKFSVTVQYFFHPKWSISGGLNYIKDSYDAGSTDYSPEEGYWSNQVLPDWTSATCEVLELPLSIHFYPKGYHSSGLFGGLGISSSIMINEAYYYHYRDPKPEYRKYWHGHMASKDWVSVLEFSIGYQKKLTKRSMLRFYPYAQLPIAGIGHGNVMLKNIGASVQFGLRL